MSIDYHMHRKQRRKKMSDRKQMFLSIVEDVLNDDDVDQATKDGIILRLKSVGYERGFDGRIIRRSLM